MIAEMNVDTVISNLERTIQGKMALLESYRACYKASRRSEIALAAVIDFLKININELVSILDDLKRIQQKK